jgi:hypothetical protein
MAVPTITLQSPIPSGAWTLYFHSHKEKRWTLETFQKIASVTTLQDVLGIFKELGEKCKAGMFFWMRDPYPPLWENYHHIRGGSYSVRGSQENGIDIYKKYVLASMFNLAAVDSNDMILGVTISPKVVGTGPSARTAFYIIKIWNRDAATYNTPAGIYSVDEKVLPTEILYTPHTEKKM